MALISTDLPSAPLGLGLTLPEVTVLQPPEEEPFTLLEAPPDRLLAELYPPPPGENASDSDLNPNAIQTTAAAASRTQNSLAAMFSPPCVTPSPRSARASHTARSARQPLLSARGGAGGLQLVGLPAPPQIDYAGLERAFERLRTASVSLAKKPTRRVGRIDLRVTQNSAAASPLISPKQSTSAQPLRALPNNAGNNGGNGGSGGDDNNAAGVGNGALPLPVPRRFLREIKAVEGSKQDRIARISKMLSHIVQAGDVEQLVEGLEMYSNTDEYAVNFANARVFGEPLLVTAIKHNKKAVALELLARGSDAFQSVRTIDLNRRSASIDVFYTTPRELAYQHAMYELVDQMDAMERAERLASDPTLPSSQRVSWLYRHPESPFGMRVVRPPTFEATSAHSEPLNPYLRRYRARLQLHSVKSYSAIPSIPTHRSGFAQLGDPHTSRTSHKHTHFRSSPVDEALTTSRSSSTAVVRHTATKSVTMRHSTRE